MKLLGHSIVRGVIRCDSGLRIGGSKDSLEIGAKDNPILRHPVNGLPYIPGSSLKGKMRSLLEVSSDTYAQREGKACDCASCDICKFFGCGDPNKAKEPTWLIFRDGRISSDSEILLREAQEEGINFSEIKYETWIDRRTNKAGNRGLRNQERVPEGTIFMFEISIRHFQNQNDCLEKLKTLLIEGLHLMQNDYLGSSGSRGYGKISFVDLTFDGVPIPGFEVTPQVPETSPASADSIETEFPA